MKADRKELLGYKKILTEICEDCEEKGCDDCRISNAKANIKDELERSAPLYVVVKHINCSKPYVFKSEIMLCQGDLVLVETKIKWDYAECLTNAIPLTDEQLDFLCKSQNIEEVTGRVLARFALVDKKAAEISGSIPVRA